MASAMFIAGPAAATSTMSRRGLRSAPKIDRHRLGVAEQEWRVQQQQHAGNRMVPNGSMCLTGLKLTRPSRQARVVAEKMRDEAVRGFMERDGDDHRDDPDRREINRVCGHRSNPVFACRSAWGIRSGNVGSVNAATGTRCYKLRPPS